MVGIIRKEGKAERAGAEAEEDAGVEMEEEEEEEEGKEEEDTAAAVLVFEGVDADRGVEDVEGRDLTTDGRDGDAADMRGVVEAEETVTAEVDRAMLEEEEALEEEVRIADVVNGLLTTVLVR